MFLLRSRGIWVSPGFRWHFGSSRIVISSVHGRPTWSSLLFSQITLQSILSVSFPLWPHFIYIFHVEFLRCTFKSWVLKCSFTSFMNVLVHQQNYPAEFLGHGYRCVFACITGKGHRNLYPSSKLIVDPRLWETSAMNLFTLKNSPMASLLLWAKPEHAHNPR